MIIRTKPFTLALVSYEKADVIETVLDSVAKGSLLPDLLLLSDDGSKDGTPDIAEAACKRLGIPCRVIRHPRSAPFRLQTMRNSVFSEALEGVVLLSDSDCVFSEHTLEAHARIHEEHPRAIGTGCRFEYLEGTEGDYTSMYSTLEASHCPIGHFVIPFGANMSTEKKLWRELGGFDRSYEGKYGFDDHEFTFRAEMRGARVVSDPGAYLFHCPHETQFGARDSGSNQVTFQRDFGRSGSQDDADFVRTTILPHYWRGSRKPTILGEDRITFDEWGAPNEGYHPPPHLSLMKSLYPLVAKVADFVSAKGRKEYDALVQYAGTIQTHRILQHTATHHLCANLEGVLGLHDFETSRTQLMEKLDRWLTWQEAIAPCGSV